MPVPTPPTPIDRAAYEALRAGHNASETLGPTPQIGEAVGPYGNSNQNGVMLPDGEVDFMPYTLPPGTYDAVLIRTGGNAASAGATIRAGIYSDNGGLPGTLLAQTGAVAATSPDTGLTMTLGATITVTSTRLIWAGATSQGGATTRPSVQRSENGFNLPWALHPSGLFDDWYTIAWGRRATGITSTFPTTVTTSASWYNTQGSKLFFRRSA